MDRRVAVEQCSHVKEIVAMCLYCDEIFATFHFGTDCHTFQYTECTICCSGAKSLLGSPILLTHITLFFVSLCPLFIMVEDYPGTVVVNCLAYLENLWVVPDMLFNFHIFNATVRCFAVGHDEPLVFCSFGYKDFLSRGPLPCGVYQVEAKVKRFLLDSYD